MMELLGSWYLGAGVVVVLGVVVALMYEKGWLGGKARLVVMIAKSEHNLAGLRAKLERKIAAEAAKATPAAPPSVAPKDKATRIAEAKAMLDAGAITQAQYDLAVAQIVAAPT